MQQPEKPSRKEDGLTGLISKLKSNSFVGLALAIYNKEMNHCLGLLLK